MMEKSPSSQFAGIKLDQLVYVELEANGGMMLNVSETGFSFRAVSPIRPTGRIAFSFTIHGRQKLGGFGKIEWTKDDGKVAGLQFTDVTSEFLDSLRKWLAQLTAAGAPSYSESRTAAPHKSTTVGAGLHHVPDSARLAAFGAALDQDLVQSVADALGQSPAGPYVPPAIQPPAFTQPELGLNFGRSLEAGPPHHGYGGGAAATRKLPTNEPAPPSPFLNSWKYPEGGPEAQEPRFSKISITILAICFAALIIALYTSREMLGQSLISLGQKLSHPSEASLQPPPAINSEPVKPAIEAQQVNEPSLSPATKSTVRSPSLADSGASASPGTITPKNPAPAVDTAAFRDERPGPASPPRAFEDSRRRDPAEEVRALWAAVAQGNTSAEVTLAKLYLIGGGVDKNCDQAKVLLNAAAKKGNGEALVKLSQLDQQGCPQ
jgi:hypothetical protein